VPAGGPPASTHFTPLKPVGHEILGPQFLGVEIDLLEDVDDGRLQVPGQGEGRIVLRIAADLQDAAPRIEKAAEMFDEVVDFPMPPLP
jgi:hypothetical protein